MLQNPLFPPFLQAKTLAMIADHKGKEQEGKIDRYDWINDGKIEEYMSKHQHDQNADKLWLYFQSVIQWVKATFM